MMSSSQDCGQKTFKIVPSTQKGLTHITCCFINTQRLQAKPRISTSVLVAVIASPTTATDEGVALRQDDSYTVSGFYHSPHPRACTHTHTPQSSLDEGCASQRIHGLGSSVWEELAKKPPNKQTNKQNFCSSKDELRQSECSSRTLNREAWSPPGCNCPGWSWKVPGRGTGAMMKLSM